MSSAAKAVSVVTGVAGTIGKTIANNLVGLGYDVVGIDRVELHSNPGNHPGQMPYVRADLATRGEAEEAASRISELTDHVDLLVNCAGSFYSDVQIAEQSDLLLEMFGDNMASYIWMSFSLEPLLGKSNQPLVVNIASTDGIVASAGQKTEVGTSHDTVYAASKGSVVAFTRALAMRWAPLGIRVNAISPTITRTAMTASLLAEEGKEEELAEHIPLRRICEPQDIATAVQCLVPLLMTTGHILPVDGGYLCQ